MIKLRSVKSTNYLCMDPPIMSFTRILYPELYQIHAETTESVFYCWTGTMPSNQNILILVNLFLNQKACWHVLHTQLDVPTKLCRKMGEQCKILQAGIILVFLSSRLDNAAEIQEKQIQNWS